MKQWEGTKHEKIIMKRKHWDVNDNGAQDGKKYKEIKPKLNYCAVV